jgi:glycosyltransferase involved in cell wall biosynthesis
MCKVSVVMPAYNAERYVKESALSILKQTLTDFELIIIDDGSTDNTPSILRRLAASDSRIRLITQPNAGVTASLNRGIEAARSNIIARMDADDVSLPDRLQAEYDYLTQHPGVVLVGTDYNVINDGGQTLSRVRVPNEDEDLRMLLRLNSPFAHGSVMYRKADFDRAGRYRKAGGSAEDYDLWVRFASLGTLYVIPKVLFQWRLGDSNITTVKSSQVEASAAHIRSTTDNIQQIQPSFEYIRAKKVHYSQARYRNLLMSYSQLAVQLIKRRDIRGVPILSVLFKSADGRQAIADRIVKVATGGRSALIK